MRSHDVRASVKRVWIQLTADRRRFGVLCATFGVGLLLWARLIIVSNVSRTAVADQPNVGATAGASGGKGASSSKREADKRDSDGSAKTAGGALTAVEVRLSRRYERDPFVISPAYFPKAEVVATVKQEAGKLPTEAAEDASQKHARLVARLQQLLGSVRLEAVMGRTTAVIDGKRYRVGEVLPVMGTSAERFEFVLLEVRERSVVLGYRDERFELGMLDPGTAGN